MSNEDVLLKFAKNRYVVVASNARVQSSADVAYPEKVNPDFFWITGFALVDAIVLYDTKEATRTLVWRERSEIEKIFDGENSEIESVNKYFTQSIETESVQRWFEDFVAKLQEPIDYIETIDTNESFGFEPNPLPRAITKIIEQSPYKGESLRAHIRRLRAIKTNEAQQRMRQAVDVSVNAYKEVYEKISQLPSEKAVYAELTRAFLVKGGDDHAYDAIVAAGKNACTLHYVKRNAPLPENGLVLIDAAVKIGEYNADITRTWAVGTPTDREKAVHTVVEGAHKQIIKLLKPDLSIQAYHSKVDEIMKSALESLGLLNEPGDYRKYFPHAISHGLGLDVHESLGGYEVFKPGMILTVEPGIYIPEEGIGVRIEDDILITESGNENLSIALPTSL